LLLMSSSRIRTTPRNKDPSTREYVF
jgi:hypothetical protein